MMYLIVGISIFYFLFSCRFVLSHPYENLTTVEYIKKYGYPVEVHSIETPDGYILGVQRIPHGILSMTSQRCVLLVHGLSGSAENFIFLEPPDALAFYLADRGYDVWLFNARGTLHSRRHKILNPNRDRKKFWGFSWHEIGVYDLPSTINYILKKTGREKLFYVGHSQGTTALYVMLSEKPEMNEKIEVAAALASAVKLKLTHSPLFVFLPKIVPFAERILRIFNWYELVIPYSPAINNILKLLCKSDVISDVCLDLAGFFGGTEMQYFNKTLLPLILQHFPSGFPSKSLYHYAQVIVSGEFKPYDYGRKKNMKIYSSIKPPLYNLSNTKIPLGLFYTLQDPFSNVKMNQALMKEFPNVVMDHEVKLDGFNHLDFLVATNAKETVYSKIYELFLRYQ